VLDTLKTLFRNKRNYDIAIVMVFSGPAFAIADLSSLIARLHRKKVILWLHGGNLPQFRERHPRWVARVLRRGTAIVVPTGHLRGVAEEAGQEPHVIPNVLPDNIDFKERRRVRPSILWMRTFHEIYDPLVAIDVVARLAERLPDVRLMMAGQDKGMLATTRERAISVGVESHIEFPGFLGPAQKREAFESHDIFLNTTRVDNAPVSLVEAAAYGLPIVTTPSGGIPHLFEDDESALFAPPDPDAMATSILRLIESPDLVRHLASNARSVADEFTWSAVRFRWSALLDSNG
jgi:glycosyltransferase involved in cell wall biosynthesis